MLIPRTYRQTRMVTGTTSTEYNSFASTNSLQVSLETTQSDFVGFKVNTTTHSVHNGIGLLVDFLLHKVVKFALHNFVDFNFQSLDRTDCWDAIVTSETVNMEFWNENKRWGRLSFDEISCDVLRSSVVVLSISMLIRYLPYLLHWYEQCRHLQDKAHASYARQ